MKIHIAILITFIVHSVVFVAFSFKPDSLALLINGKSTPDIIFPNVINFQRNSASLSDFKGKLVILYSWTTYCAPCIESFPKLDRIQREFGDKIQIILVGYEPEEKILRLFERMKMLGKDYILPNAIVDNTTFRKLLNEDGSLGGSIWIDKNGIVLGRVKGSDNINEQNINSIINGQSYDASIFEIQNSRYLASIDNSIPLLINSNAGDNRYFKSHSIVTSYIPGLADGGVRIEGPGESSAYGKIRVLNSYVVSLYSIAYGSVSSTEIQSETIYRPQGLSSMDIEFEVSNETFFRPNLNLWDSLKQNYGYCYEIVAPCKNPEELLLSMRSDLDKFFGLRSQMEKRETECLVLVKFRDTDMESFSETKIFEKDNFGIVITNQPVSVLISALRYYLSPGKAFLDETGINHNIDINFVAEMNDLDAVNEKLKEYGLVVIKAKRYLDKLVIREKI